MISNTSLSSTAQEWTPDEMAHRGCRGLVGAAKEGYVDHDDEAFLLTSADEGSYNFTLTYTGA